MDRVCRLQGIEAEQMVSCVLNNLGVDYHVFNNIMFKTKKGTTQIDHIVVSPFGIFVIETKSHKGKIFGDCISKNWTQVLYSRQGMKRHSFYSPFLQNWGHLRSLYRLTGLPNSYFLGLICFTSVSVDLSCVQCDRVVHVNYLASTILKYRRRLFTQEQVVYICNLILKNNVQSKYFDRKHIKYVDSIK